MEIRSIQYYTNGVRDQPKVALTFDDGPTPDVTDQILQILNAKGARATFFVVGKWIDWLEHDPERRRYSGPEMLKRIQDGGHVIGNHSYLHGKPASDFEAAEEVICRLTGQATRFVRPPYYAFSTTLAHWVGQRKVIRSDVVGFDWENQISTQNIIDNVVNNTTDGSIILLHDGSDVEVERIVRPARTVAALPVIIDTLQQRGLELVGVDEMELDLPQQIDW